MFHRHVSHRYCPLLAALLALFLWAGQPQAKGQNTSSSIDFFSGINFSFSDMNFERQYDILIHLLQASSGTLEIIGKWLDKSMFLL